MGLEAPQHGLASEGNLLRWQLRTALRFGQATPPTAPLACAPPTPSPLLRSPRVLIAMPFVDAERERLRTNVSPQGLELWSFAAEPLKDRRSSPRVDRSAAGAMAAGSSRVRVRRAAPK